MLCSTVNAHCTVSMVITVAVLVLLAWRGVAIVAEDEPSTRQGQSKDAVTLSGMSCSL